MSVSKKAAYRAYPLQHGIPFADRSLLSHIIFGCSFVLRAYTAVLLLKKMHGKAADLVFKIDCNRTVVLGLGGGHIHLEAASLKLCDGGLNLVGADGDVALFAQIPALHYLNAGGGKIGGIAELHSKVKRLAELSADTLGGVRIIAVDADVAHLKAQKSLTCFFIDILSENYIRGVHSRVEKIVSVL